MTIAQPTTHVILGEIFEFDELKDVAKHGADTGVHGFTYSSDLYDMYIEYEDEIMDLLESLGYTLGDVFQERGFDTLQCFREWACWVYLEVTARRITDYDYE